MWMCDFKCFAIPSIFIIIVPRPINPVSLSLMSCAVFTCLSVSWRYLYLTLFRGILFYYNPLCCPNSALTPLRLWIWMRACVCERKGCSLSPTYNAPYGDPMERREKKDADDQRVTHSVIHVASSSSRHVILGQRGLLWDGDGLEWVPHTQTHTLLIIQGLLFTDSVWRDSLQRHTLLQALAPLHLCVCVPGSELWGREGCKTAAPLPRPASSYWVSVMAPSFTPFHSELLHVAHSLQTYSSLLFHTDVT